MEELINKYSSYTEVMQYKECIDDFCYEYSISKSDILEIFNKLYKIYTINSGKEIRDEEIFNSFIKVLSNGEFDDLIYDITKKDIEYTDDILMQINKVILKPNIYNITTLQEVFTFDKKRKTYCDNIVESIENSKENQLLQYELCNKKDESSRKCDILKSMIFQKVYNQDYKSITKFIDMYGGDTNELRDIVVDKSIENFIDVANKILNIDDLEDLKVIYKQCELGDFDFLKIENRIKAQYANMYNILNYNPQIATEIDETYENIELHNVSPEFFMTVTSFGGIFEIDKEITNYKEAWDKVESQTISTSFISNNNLSMVPIKNVCFGFCNFDSNDIIAMGSRNLYVHPNDLNPQDNLNYPDRCKYQMPWNLIENTKKYPEVTVDGENYISNYNEIVFRRKDKNNDTRMPSYVVYFSDGKIDKNDVLYKNSFKAAKDFNIPIVIVDRTKCKEKEINKNALIYKIKNLYPQPNNIDDKLNEVSLNLKNIIYETTVEKKAIDRKEKKMEYKLDERFKKRYEVLKEKIDINKDKIEDTEKKISKVDQDKNMDKDEKNVKKLNLEIKLETLENERFNLEYEKKKIYVDQAMENLKNSKINNKIDSIEFFKYKKEIDFYKAFSEYKWEKRYYIDKIEINKMKLNLENKKSQICIIPYVNKAYVAKLNSEIKELEDDIKSLKEDDLKFINKDLNKSRERHGISFKSEEPTEKELEELFSDFSEKFLEKETTRVDINKVNINGGKKNNLFENEISSRGEEKQIQDFNLELKHHDYTKNELSEKYSRHLKGEDKELAKMFAYFQKVKKGKNYFEYEDTELQNIVEYKDTDGETYYNIIYRNSIENDGIVQTYTKDENGKLKLYSEREYDDFYQEMSNYDNKDKRFSLEDAKIKMKKSLIEDELGKERVTEITEITDTKFLEDFAKQTGQGENGLYNATIVSSINEKGEEDYDIVFADYSTNRISTMPGIKALNKDRNNIQIDSGMSIPTQDGQKGGKIYDSITNLKEFETLDGHRYAISRDSKGKLGFTEIYKEKEQSTFGKNVNTYTFEDLKETYERKNINQTDLNKAFDTINITKQKQQQQTKSQIDFESEGR